MNETKFESDTSLITARNITLRDDLVGDQRDFLGCSINSKLILLQLKIFC